MKPKDLLIIDWLKDKIHYRIDVVFCYEGSLIRVSSEVSQSCQELNKNDFTECVHLYSLQQSVSKIRVLSSDLLIELLNPVNQ